MLKAKVASLDLRLLVIVSSLVFQIGFFVPLQVFLRNILEFSSGFTQLLGIFLLTSLTLTAVLYLIAVRIFGSLFQGGVALISVLFFLESTIFFVLAGHRPFDGQTIHWTELSALSTVEMIVAAILTVSVAKLRNNSGLFSDVAVFILLFHGTFFLHTALSGLEDIQRNRGSRSTEAPYLADFYRLSKQRNIVQVVVDHTQGSLVYDILRADLHRYSEVFDGFTLFTQAAGKYPGTYPAVPFYMTGRAPDVGSNVVSSLPYSHDHIRTVLREHSFVNTLAKNGFKTYAFQLSTLYCEGRYTACTAGNVFTGLSRPTTSEEAVAEILMLLDVALFKATPILLRRYVHNDGQWLLLRMNKQRRTPSGIMDLFVAQLTTDESPGSYNYFHHAGGHPPIQFNRQCEYVGTQKWDYPNTQGQVACFLLQMEHLVRKLKGLGIYDQSMIIVNGDHGSQWTTPLMTSPTGSVVPTRVISSANPVLFMKPLRTRGPLQFSNAPASVGDIPATISEAFGLNADFPGISVFRLGEDEERERTYLWYKPRPEVFSEQQLPRTMPYRIRGNLFNQYAWVPPILSDIDNAPAALTVDQENFLDFTQGFGKLEVDDERPARWVEGKLARAYLSFAGKGRARLTVECTVPPAIGKQSLKIFVNGETVARLDEAALSNRSRHVIPLPDQLSPERLHIIEFQAGNTVKIGNDPRELSLRFVSLEIESVP